MAAKLPKNSVPVHVPVHVKKIVLVDMAKKKWSEPKIYIPKKGGKPTLDKSWYVYYYFEHPLTHKKHSQPFKLKGDINTFDTVRERKAYGKRLINTLIEEFKNGFTPFMNVDFQQETTAMTIVEALDYAIEKKKPDLKPIPYQDYTIRKNSFVAWLKANNLQTVLVQDFNKKMFGGFFNHIAEKTSNRNANNFKSTISSLLTKLVDDDLLDQNILLHIKKRPTKPTKHRAFTGEELQKIKTHLLANNLQLYRFMCFVAYGFLRNVEVTRLKDQDFNFENWTMRVETKTERFEVIRIIETLKPIVKDMGIKGTRNAHIFTPTGTIEFWPAIDKSRVSYFRKQFATVKKELKLHKDHTIYSMRHTLAVNIYNQHLANGLTDKEAILKMLPVTRHKNESGLRNYLRSVNAFVAKDYSKDITIDF